MNFVVGQRWASHAETALGLGIVSEAGGRRVSISFPAAAETRTYATDSAPLSRIHYAVGDTISNMEDESFVVTDLDESDGLITYECLTGQGEHTNLHELELNCFVQFTTPQQRLFAGQLDDSRAFNLRIETLEHLNRLQQSPARGLLGSRTTLLPHQVYIASEVARRHAPRVLLADEVGLGKTIEAGMILHHQVYTGRAERILIVVPDSLIHQWLVEMLRRFNLSFAIFDESRIEALADSGYDNPFDSEQLVLCSMTLLTNNPVIQAHACSADWHLVVVDEAHHLQWTHTGASEEYRCVEELAARTAGLLLLTATPEQVGVESHFARLRLLDPDRFHDLETFLAEQDGYQKVNDLAGSLLDSTIEIPAEDIAYLSKLLGHDVEPGDRQRAVDELLDRHGTGRVLFRNTRSAVAGFPVRVVHAYPLPADEHYELDSLVGEIGLNPETAAASSTEENDHQPWVYGDPRVAWLVGKLRELRREKVLLICHSPETADELDKYLNLGAGIRSTAFYEGLSILERDRCAAYFAEPEGGAQVLVCSEIGSEGRNFQFAHHLILFDLPLNPDLLEQRIGRLDRIGQLNDIEIHVPHLVHGSGVTAQQVLFRWYNEGIGMFERSCSAGYAIYEAFRNRLATALAGQENELDALLTEVSAYTEKTLATLHDGRDRLLELNSCRTNIAAELINSISREEQVGRLPEWMKVVFDRFGVDNEYHSEDSLVLRPGENMEGHFPGLAGNGMTVTYSRERALAREDMEFLSWEHPMVAGCLEMIRTGEVGNATVSTIAVRSMPAGSILLETYFVADVVAHKNLEIERYLPVTPTRLLVGGEGRDLTDVLSHEKLDQFAKPVPRKVAQAAVQRIRDPIIKTLARAQELADRQLPGLLKRALNTLDDSLCGELDRLEALHKVNPSIRDDEIDFMRARIDACREHIERAAMQLQAVRVVINNPG
jgi:ATP-dependent helicase HepA